MKKIVYIIFVALLTAVTGPVCGQHTLGNIPEGWKVKANGDSVPVVNGTATITDGATVVLTPPNPAFVKSVTLTDAPAPAPSCRRVDLSQITADSVMQDCDTLTGTLAANVKISIAAGATVTLDGVSINANGSWTTGNFAGITCLGNATIILKDGTTNTVKGFYENNPGIFVPVNSTLTIKGETLGTGKLIASSDGLGAGIGGGFYIPCGNIRIDDGIIEATGGKWAAGIGSGVRSSCGAITITGGTVEATGGNSAAGIGGGQNANCGNITISGGTVNATGGYRASGIGSGRRVADVNSVSCGNITINGGTITATGGEAAAGIGGGRGNNPSEITSCGAITITSGVTSVTATKGGTNAPNSIGAGYHGTCGTVTIGGAQGAITTSPYTYPPQP